MIFKWWRKRQRNADLALLWPACKKYAPTLGDARYAFLLHTEMDPAWTKDYTSDELVEFVNGLD